MIPNDLSLDLRRVSSGSIAGSPPSTGTSPGSSGSRFSLQFREPLEGSVIKADAKSKEVFEAAKKRECNLFCIGALRCWKAAIGQKPDDFVLIKYGDIECCLDTENPAPAALAIKATVEKLKVYHDLCLEGFSTEEMVEDGSHYPFSKILEAIYASPVCKRIMEEKRAFRDDLAASYFKLRGFKDLYNECAQILRLFSDYKNCLKKAVKILRDSQKTILNQAPSVRIIREAIKLKTPTKEDYLKILTNKDSGPFFCLFHIEDLGSLDEQHVLDCMAELLVHPEEIPFVFAGNIITIRWALSKEQLKPLREILKTFAKREKQIELISNGELFLQLVSETKPINKIKERLQELLRELIKRIVFQKKLPVESYLERIALYLPSAKKGVATDWKKAFTLLDEVIKDS